MFPQAAQDEQQERHHEGQKPYETLQGEVHEKGHEEVGAMYRSHSGLPAVLLLRERVLRGMHE